jgi:uncharacterized protein (DUF488 family)
VRTMFRPIYTVGYEGRSLADMLEDLSRVGVTRLVDVRELPLSRRPGFSKTKFAAALADAGIDYQHIKPLGNPKPNRDRYRSGDVEGGARTFRAHLHNGSYPALVQLASSLEDGTTCLMCFERDHTICHRDVIVGSLTELQPDLTVTHL